MSAKSARLRSHSTKCKRQIRERRHVAGDHIEKVFAARRPVRDPAAERILFVNDVDA